MTENATHSVNQTMLPSAQEARVGLTDRIFTRLASSESAAAPQSTFMIDLSQVAAMLRMSTERWVAAGGYVKSSQAAGPAALDLVPS